MIYYLIHSNNVTNVPPNTTRHTMHWGTALPLTSCSYKAEGHPSRQRCSQRLARRTNGCLFSVLLVCPPTLHPLPAVLHAPAAPEGWGGQRRCLCRLPCPLARKTFTLKLIKKTRGANPIPQSGKGGGHMVHSIHRKFVFVITERSFRTHRPAAPLLPQPAQGSANPPMREPSTICVCSATKGPLVNDFPCLRWWGGKVGK